MVVYIVTSDYKGVETHIEGVYSSQKEAEDAVGDRIDCDIYPYHVDGELGNSNALWFVSYFENGRYIVSPLDTTLIEGYALGVPEFLILSTGEEVARVAVEAFSQENAQQVAKKLFQKAWTVK